MRRSHVLTGINTSPYPHAMMFYDTETTTLLRGEKTHNPQLRLGVCDLVEMGETGEYHTRYSETFKTRDHFASMVIEASESLGDVWVFSHNCSFDVPVTGIIGRLAKAGFKCVFVVDQSPPFVVKMEREGATVTLIDTLNFFQTSAASLGKMVGLPKLDTDVETSDVDKLEEYCRRDVEIIKRSMLVLIDFLRAGDYSGLGLTISSLAFNTFRKCFMTSEIYIDGFEERNKIGRASYSGGRTEAFYIGRLKGRYHFIDINSQYPSVMRNNRFPTRTIARHKRLEPDDLIRVDNNLCITAEVLLNTDIPAYPTKRDGRTIFPVGRFVTTLSTPELHYAYSHGHIEAVYQAVFHESDYIFSEYVEHFYKERMKYKRGGDGAFEQLCKKMLNTLYGKFGQKGVEWELTDIAPEGRPRKWSVVDLPTRTRISYMELEGSVYRETNDEESDNSFPAIAAHVTAHGRMVLQLTMDYLGSENVFYCDTDSLMINDAGFEKIKDKIDDETLGCWGYEGYADDPIIYGAKDYVFGDKVRHKGVSMKAVEGEVGEFTQLQFSSFKWSVTKGRLRQAEIRRVLKRLKRIYTKGEVLPDGSVKPFTLTL